LKTKTGHCDFEKWKSGNSARDPHEPGYYNRAGLKLTPARALD